MNTWNLFQVIFQLNSNLHVGKSKTGNIQYTYPYVHGRTFWGALTARLTRIEKEAPTGKDYKDIGDWISQSLAFSYFFPSVKKNPEWLHFFPWRTDPSTNRFISSYCSSPWSIDSQSAQASLLHEIEFICPKTRDTNEQIYLVGYLGIKNSEIEKYRWRAAMNGLQLGGEIGYGWGAVSCESIIDISDDPKIFDFSNVDLSTDRISIHLEAEDILHAHTNSQVDAKGQVVPFVCRQWRNDEKKEKILGAGQEINHLGIFWAPGSMVNEKVIVEIGAYGIWEVKKRKITVIH